MILKQIRNIVEDYCNLNISNRTREYDVVKNRFMYYYLCYKYASGYVNEKRIGQSLKYDRCSVIHGLKAFESIILSDELMRKDLNIVEGIIKNKTKSVVNKKADLTSIEKLKLSRMNYELKLKLAKAKKEIRYYKQELKC